MSVQSDNIENFFDMACAYLLSKIKLLVSAVQFMILLQIVRIFPFFLTIFCNHNTSIQVLYDKTYARISLVHVYVVLCLAIKVFQSDP